MKLKGGYNTEFARTATHLPKEIFVLILAGGANLTVDGNNLDGAQVVTGEPPLAAKPAHAASQRKTGHTSYRDLTARRHQAMELRFLVEVAPVRAGLNMCRACPGIYVNTFHQ